MRYSDTWVTGSVVSDGPLSTDYSRISFARAHWHIGFDDGLDDLMGVGEPVSDRLAKSLSSGKSTVLCIEDVVDRAPDGHLLPPAEYSAAAPWVTGPERRLLYESRARQLEARFRPDVFQIGNETWIHGRWSLAEYGAVVLGVRSAVPRPDLLIDFRDGLLDRAVYRVARYANFHVFPATGESLVSTLSTIRSKARRIRALGLEPTCLEWFTGRGFDSSTQRGADRYRAMVDVFREEGIEILGLWLGGTTGSFNWRWPGGSTWAGLWLYTRTERSLSVSALWDSEDEMFRETIEADVARLEEELEATREAKRVEEKARRRAKLQGSIDVLKDQLRRERAWLEQEA